MCLIAFVPKGAAIPRDIFNHAGRINDDGYGVMSVERGVERFYGRKAKKRARRYSELLSGEGIPHAVHMRYATHGRPSLELCHPFTTKGEHPAHVMHNGVLHELTAFTSATESDTSLFVDMLDDVPAPVAPGEDSPYWGMVRELIGTDNRMVVLHGESFFILNEKQGTWRDGVWYSNAYSLPHTYDDSGWDDWLAKRRESALIPFNEPYNTPVGQTYDLRPESTAGDYGYAIGKRYNPVLLRWEYPHDKVPMPSGPTLDADPLTIDELRMLRELDMADDYYDADHDTRATMRAELRAMMTPDDEDYALSEAESEGMLPAWGTVRESE